MKTAALLLVSGLVGNQADQFANTSVMRPDTSTVITRTILSGNIAIEGDIYLVVNTQAFAVTVKSVRLYTNSTKMTLVDSYEGCALPACTYNLVTEGLISGTYFVEVETYSNTFFSDWITYE